MYAELFNPDMSYSTSTFSLTNFSVRLAVVQGSLKKPFTSLTPFGPDPRVVRHACKVFIFSVFNSDTIELVDEREREKSFLEV